MKIAYFDLETQYLLEEVGGREFIHRLKVAVAGVLIEGEIYLFEENEINKLIELLRGSDLIVGHNLFRFDYRVLIPYVENRILEGLKNKTFDTWKELEKLTGQWIALDDLGERNFGMKKLFDSKDVPIKWRNGAHQEVKEYLKNDLNMTQKLHEHGLNNKKIKYGHKDYGKFKEEREVLVKWV